MKASIRRFVLVAFGAAALASCNKMDDIGTLKFNLYTADTSGTLKSAATGFPVGLTVNAGLWSNNAVYRSTVGREAGSVTFENEMKYGSIVRNDGSFNFATADALMNGVTGSGLEVFGHVLGWHSQQNGTYLKNFAGIVAPTATELLTNNPGFENGLSGWSTFNASNGATVSHTTTAAEVRTGSGAMRVVNPVANPGNQWRVQVSSATFATVPNRQYTISYWVRAAAPGGSIRLSSGPTSPQYQGDQAIGTSWQQVTWTITASLAQTTFLFDMGQAANTYFIDDVSVREVVQAPSGAQIAARLDQALNNWITTIVTRYRGRIKSWEAVNELFAENGALRNNTNTNTTPNDVVVWSHYMGRDFAFKAFQYARAADPQALLYINDFNLELNGPKLDSFVAFVNLMKANNIPVDGVGTQMHTTINASRANIDAMFRKLAGTGLKVRITELDVRMNPGDKTGFQPNQQMQSLQAEMYNYIIKSYIRNVPAAQRAGVTVWGVDDPNSWIVLSQRRNDFPLLFDGQFAKKPAYGAFRNALMQK